MDSTKGPQFPHADKMMRRAKRRKQVKYRGSRPTRNNPDKRKDN